MSSTTHPIRSHLHAICFVIGHGFGFRLGLDCLASGTSLVTLSRALSTDMRIGSMAFKVQVNSELSTSGIIVYSQTLPSELLTSGIIVYSLILLSSVIIVSSQTSPSFFSLDLTHRQYMQIFSTTLTRLSSLNVKTRTFCTRVLDALKETKPIFL